MTRRFRLWRDDWGCASLFLIPFVLGGILLLSFGIQEYLNYRTLRDTGVETRGRFIDRRIQYGTDSDGNQTIDYYVTFRFLIGEDGYNVEEEVSERTYETAANGEPLNVIYAPDNPQLATIEPLSPIDSFVLIGFGLCWNIVIWGFIFMMIRRW